MYGVAGGPEIYTPYKMGYVVSIIRRGRYAFGGGGWGVLCSWPLYGQCWKCIGFIVRTNDGVISPTRWALPDVSVALFE